MNISGEEQANFGELARLGLALPLAGKRLAAPAPGLWRLPLASFFPEVHALTKTFLPTRADYLLGWGYKAPSYYARRLARVAGRGYLALEDGFLRSIGVGETGAPPASIVADDVGVYYDASRPSRLETLIARGADFSNELMEEARALRALKNKHRLSKYNDGAPLRAGVLPRTDRDLVLLVDQTAGDASIRMGGAAPGAFEAMAEAARREHPGCAIIAKRHPVVMRRYKAGALPAEKDVHFLEENFDPIEVLEQTAAVYTVSSLLGFEALLLGKRVVCFGAPFYAGWGVTDDRAPTPARRGAASVDQIFAAAYLLYPRYRDPLTGKACAPRVAMERLATMKRHDRALSGRFVALNFSPAKRPVLRSFFAGPSAQLRFGAAPRAGESALAWASRITPEALSRAGGAPVIHVEDGFIRSAGLGSSFHAASSYVFDGDGIYYDPRTPSGLQKLLSEARFAPDALRRAAALRARIVALRLSKYNLAEPAPDFRAPAGKRRILVPGQVENDASILYGAAAVRTNRALLAAVRGANPDAWIVFKEHPDVTAGNRPGKVGEREARRWADAAAAGVDISDCLDLVDEVHTISSLTGFEALLRGKAVTAYGAPFYAGWGLTNDMTAIEGRGRARALDELVAAALISYPLYLDPISRLPCEPEFLIERLAQLKANGVAARRPAPSWRRFLRGARESWLRKSAPPF